MHRDSVYTAIDVGTDKCVTLIATTNPESQQLRVVGVSVVPSKGVRKSAIVDLEKVTAAINESLDGAERMAGFEVQQVYVSVSGTHINSRNSKGVVAVAAPDQEITRLDVERVIEAARAVSLPTDTQIMHVIPRDFRVDSQEGIKDPVGMTGVRLEAEAHLITGMSVTLRNLEKCMNDLGLQVKSFVFSGLASAQVALTETEKELGVVLVDIGAGTTSLCAYVDGAIQYSGSLPIGARHITQDIALGCRISLEDAEQVKLALSTGEYEIIKPLPGESKEDLAKRRKKADQLDPEKIGLQGFAEPLSKRTLVEGIMAPRMKEMFELIGQRLSDQNILDKVPAGLVLCGGGAETVQITEIAKRTLNIPARVGVPSDVQGLVSDISRPSFAASVGLLSYAQNQGGGAAKSTPLSIGSVFKQVDVKQFSGWLKKLVQSVLP